MSSFEEEVYGFEKEAGEHDQQAAPYTLEYSWKGMRYWSMRAQLEAQRGWGLYGSFNSRHEAYAVLLEEIDELWEEVKANRKSLATGEAVQVAAMALRFLTEFGEEDYDADYPGT
jgi:hypothetical protein